ncbi:spore germination protein [Lysinibacillus endophyticus]|uniref:spore germination protein n=1 Tax=Ureibacillus endophyticus TaxID=1978490 RepID=UPI00209E94B9|nr:spore germination protein [Lysinibacillus endophyticus]
MEEQLTQELQNNFRKILKYFSYTEDLATKEMIFDNKNCTILFLDSMVNKEQLQTFVIAPILEAETREIDKVVEATEVQAVSSISEIGSKLMEGCCVILIEGREVAWTVSVAETTSRSIETPANERSIKSAHDGFVESIGTNLLLIRRRVKTPQLKVQSYTLGRQSNTKVNLVYLANLANSEMVEEIKRRVSSIDVDQLLSSGEIEEFIEDNPYSPFPQMLHTERPDRAVSYLTEGKVLLLVDGDPRVLIMPITFFAFYQASDDYNSRWMVGTFFRCIRFLSYIISICLPAIYIAIVSYHSEVLPIGILYSVRVSLENVPFHPFIEAFTMQIVLELLKEASIRLPTPIAQTIGIVGGVVIGTAVVEASFVSNTMVVIIGLTAISSFVAPVNEMGTSARLLGFPVMVAAAVLGFFGIAIVLMVIVMHLCKLETFGMPYFSPLAPLKEKDLKDTLIRMPAWKMVTRPSDSLPAYKKQQWRTRGWKKS